MPSLKYTCSCSHLLDTAKGERVCGSVPRRSWTLSPDMTALLDNKARFSDYAASLGLAVPQHHVVSSPAQLRAINNNPKVHCSNQRGKACNQ